VKKTLLFTTTAFLCLAAATFGQGGRGGGGRGGRGGGGGRNAPANRGAPGVQNGFGGMPGQGGFGGFGDFDAGFGNAGNTPDPEALRNTLRATNEEWMVIWAKLQEIIRLRAEVHATAADGDPTGASNMMFGGAGMPGGGNSLEGPASQGPDVNLGRRGGMGGGQGGFGGNQNPFTPPQTGQSGGRGGTGGFGGFGGSGGGRGGFGRLTAGGFGNMLDVGSANGVAALMVELQNLLADKSTSDEQIREKLEAIRATRQKDVRDLAAAQADILPLLTTRQVAMLTALGYLD
jgi:hypothetical protein